MTVPPGHESFSQTLERWLRADGPKTLGDLNQTFAENGFAVSIMLLMLLPALPLPTGGVSHLFEAIAVVLAAEMALGRTTVWLPARWQNRQLGSLTTASAIPLVARWLGHIERLSKPRGAPLFRHEAVIRLLGVVLIVFCTAAAAAPPFSGLDTFPAMGAVGVSLSIVLRDILVLAIAIVLGVAGILLIITLGATLLHLLRHAV